MREKLFYSCNISWFSKSQGTHFWSQTLRMSASSPSHTMQQISWKISAHYYLAGFFCLQNIKVHKFIDRARHLACPSLYLASPPPALTAVSGLFRTSSHQRLDTDICWCPHVTQGPRLHGHRGVWMMVAGIGQRVTNTASVLAETRSPESLWHNNCGPRLRPVVGRGRKKIHLCVVRHKTLILLWGILYWQKTTLKKPLMRSFCLKPTVFSKVYKEILMPDFWMSCCAEFFLIPIIARKQAWVLSI